MKDRLLIKFCFLIWGFAGIANAQECSAVSKDSYCEPRVVAYNPPAYLKCCSDEDAGANSLVLRGDLLWWRAYEEGIALGDVEATSQFTSVPNRLLITNVSRQKHLHNHYEPGFRIGLERNCSCQCWDFALNWTHFHSKAAEHVHGIDPLSPRQTLFISFWERGDNLFPLHAKGTWKLGIDLLDLDVGYRYYTFSCLTLKPFFGLRGVRLTQTYLTESRANRNIGIGESDHFMGRTKSRANFTGLGPILGLGVEFDMGCSWSIVANSATSLVFGRVDRHSKEHMKEFESAETLDFYYRSRQGFGHSSKAITDCSLGLQWRRCFDFCQQMRTVRFIVAWEHHLFHRFNTFDFVSQGILIGSGELTAPTGGKRGDLSTQGLTASLQVGF